MGGRRGGTGFLRVAAPQLGPASIGAARNPWRSTIRNASLIPPTPYCPTSSAKLFIAATACEGNRHATRHTQQWRLLHWHGMPPAPPDASLVTPCSVPQARLGIQPAPSVSIEGSAFLKMLAQSSQKGVLREAAKLRHSLVLVRFRNSEIVAFDDILYGVRYPLTRRR